MTHPNNNPHIMKKIITILLLLSTLSQLYGQRRPALVIKITDARDSTTLAGATVHIAGAGQRYVSDLKGLVHISQSPPLHLRISFVGFIQEALLIDHFPKDTIRVALK